MKALRDNFGVQGECYASPSNRYGVEPWTFCSAYPETDGWFGSSGSFFNFWPIEGSFECNPPFSVDAVDSMFAHIKEIFSKSSGSLSFCVIMPGNHWKKFYRDTGREDLAELIRHEEILEMGEHLYLTGNWINSAEVEEKDTWTANMDTALIWIQNASGNAKWPVDPEKVTNVTKAFRGIHGDSDTTYTNI